MNKQQKEVQQVFLDNEKEVLNNLKKNYRNSLAEINRRIEFLMARQDADMQHVIYQLEYQKQLKTQVQGILEELQNNNFETLSGFMTKSYEDGFLGTMYDMQGQGIPLIFPIDQEQVIDAIQHETKLSESLYTSLGHDTKSLQKQIQSEISRGISSAEKYTDIARNIEMASKVPLNRAMTIARTEAHRIQIKATSDAQHKAKEKGADVVKQWDAALDDKTRESHRDVDGEIRELDEKFSNGLMYPGDPNGGAAEVVNCRCALLQRARWALGNNYTKWSADADIKTDKDGTMYTDLSSAKNYSKFKGMYKDAQGQMTMNFTKGLGAKSGNFDVPDHSKPVLEKTIDYSDKDAVKKELLHFEQQAVRKNIETACVITKDGDVFTCTGIKDRVFPDFDLGEKLHGASVSHNHTADCTQYSFSSDDFELFQKYQLEKLNGVDVKYKYEFSRSSDIVDKHKTIFEMTDEDFAHEEAIRMAENAHVGYRRRSNE